MADEPRINEHEQATQPVNASQAQPASPKTPMEASQGQAQPAASQTKAQPAATQPQAQPQAEPAPQQPASPYGYAQPQPVYVAPAQPKASKAPWIVLGVLLFAIVFCFTVGAMSCSSAVKTVASMAGGAGSSAVSATGPTVAVIEISGTIQYDGTSCSPEGLSQLLDEAEADSNIKAVVLRVNSGGGTATAGEEMANLVKNFSKPVVVSSASMNCSAAYEISSQADKIFVSKTTEIGSIGTAMQLTDLSGLLDKLGIKVDNITSADSKDSTYGTRELTDAEREYYQQFIDKVNDVFIENVMEGRSMTEEQVRALATGLAFSGTEAVENGLADEVGFYDDALECAAQLGGIQGDYDVQTLTTSSSSLSISDLLGSDSGNTEISAAAAKLIELLKEEGVL